MQWSHHYRLNELTSAGTGSMDSEGAGSVGSAFALYRFNGLRGTWSLGSLGTWSMGSGSTDSMGSASTG